MVTIDLVIHKFSLLPTKEWSYPIENG